jgi:hypothetical protein
MQQIGYSAIGHDDFARIKDDVASHNRSDPGLDSQTVTRLVHEMPRQFPVEDRIVVYDFILSARIQNYKRCDDTNVRFVCDRFESVAAMQDSRRFPFCFDAACGNPLLSGKKIRRNFCFVSKNTSCSVTKRLDREISSRARKNSIN